MRIVEARELRSVVSFGKMDPFAIVRCRDEAVKSPVMRDAHAAPVFDWKTMVRAKLADNVAVEVFNEGGTLHSEKPIGAVVFAVSDLRSGEVADRWYTLTFEGQAAGEVRIRSQLMHGGENPISAPAAHAPVHAPAPAMMPAPPAQMPAPPAQMPAPQQQQFQAQAPQYLPQAPQYQQQFPQAQPQFSQQPRPQQVMPGFAQPQYPYQAPQYQQQFPQAQPQFQGYPQQSGYPQQAGMPMMQPMMQMQMQPVQMQMQPVQMQPMMQMQQPIMMRKFPQNIEPLPLSLPASPIYRFLPLPPLCSSTWYADSGRGPARRPHADPPAAAAASVPSVLSKEEVTRDIPAIGQQLGKKRPSFRALSAPLFAPMQ